MGGGAGGAELLVDECGRGGLEGLALGTPRRLGGGDDPLIKALHGLIDYAAAQQREIEALKAALRRQGIKLRPTDNMGLAGHWRLSVQPPAAQAALHQALLQHP